MVRTCIRIQMADLPNPRLRRASQRPSRQSISSPHHQSRRRGTLQLSTDARVPEDINAPLHMPIFHVQIERDDEQYTDFQPYDIKRLKEAMRTLAQRLEWAKFASCMHEIGLAEHMDWYMDELKAFCLWDCHGVDEGDLHSFDDKQRCIRCDVQLCQVRYNFPLTFLCPTSLSSSLPEFSLTYTRLLLILLLSELHQMHPLQMLATNQQNPLLVPTHPQFSPSKVDPRSLSRQVLFQ